MSPVDGMNMVSGSANSSMPPAMDAQAEQRHLLESRLATARERILYAENELAMWRPVEASSVAGLRGLDEAQGDLAAKSVVQAGHDVSTAY